MQWMVGREAGDRRGGCSWEEAEEAPKGRGRSQAPWPRAEKAGFGARPQVWSQRPLHVQAVLLTAAGCVLSHPGQRACPAQEAGTGAGEWLLSPKETDKRRPGPLRLPQLWRESSRDGSPCPPPAGRLGGHPAPDHPYGLSPVPAPSRDQPGVQLGEGPQVGSHSWAVGQLNAAFQPYSALWERTHSRGSKLLGPKPMMAHSDPLGGVLGLSFPGGGIDDLSG